MLETCRKLKQEMVLLIDDTSSLNQLNYL